ncbi:DUF4233 domain-containing protein [Actinomadura flavalba]|uniref:DUF4233 domain-containing protein n=1 Tax=Actinomadura flavalba TaxID=1120938 RepID=UPI00036596DF|nr:DUF4233 domain-containing protein [Actinomadura flavalba]
MTAANTETSTVEKRDRTSGGRGARSLLAAVLTAEAIIIGLAVPVAIQVNDVSPGRAAGVCGGLAVLALLVAGMLRRSWAVHLGTALQVAIIGTGFLVPTMFFLGVLFGALWGTALWLGRKAESAQAR